MYLTFETEEGYHKTTQFSFNQSAFTNASTNSPKNEEEEEKIHVGHIPF